jgi:small-conductance mechanosensitive channel
MKKKKCRVCTSTEYIIRVLQLPVTVMSLVIALKVFLISLIIVSLAASSRLGLYIIALSFTNPHVAS